MDMAVRISAMSYSKRKQVGGILVKDNNIISFGWNGTPHGFDNCCENSEGNTLEYVVHAEENIITKLAKAHGNASGSHLYLTLSPCYNCSKLIVQSDICFVYYLEEYRDKRPIEFLQRANVNVMKFSDLLEHGQTQPKFVKF
jgi:dCMP deaminase